MLAQQSATWRHDWRTSAFGSATFSGLTSSQGSVLVYLLSPASASGDGRQASRRRLERTMREESTPLSHRLPFERLVTLNPSPPGTALWDLRAALRALRRRAMAGR